ncbi:MAG: ferritin family protein [Candidatus Bipolaricaulota bacterium]|nr:MAG: ferritin family protein [Candidatus Bipolaricaulota bacterium]
MTDQALQEIVREAMAAERNGYQFYSMAAERSDDPGARGAFSALAEDERRHHELLRTRYGEIVRGEPVDWSELRGHEAASEGPGGFFSEAFHERLEGRHLEMSALAIGILLERESIAFYSRSAAEASDPEVRAFFEGLAAWENEHYQALLRQQDALKDEYWRANRFEPLL